MATRSQELRIRLTPDEEALLLRAVEARQPDLRRRRLPFSAAGQARAVLLTWAEEQLAAEPQASTPSTREPSPRT